MTNRERYKQAFSAIHAPAPFILEVEKMKKAGKKHTVKSMIVAAAVCIMVMGSATAVYAADVGGIQRAIQLWIQGDKTQATIEFDGNGHYSMQYADSDGNIKQQAGGGVAIEDDGTERPLSEEELLEKLATPEVEYADDGTVTVYWLDQAIDITDKFEDDVCYVKLVNGDKTVYMTVKYQNGYACDPHKYESPASFN